MSKTILTISGKKKLQEELNLLIVEKGKAIEELSDARDRGGIDENVEYEAAKEECERVRTKIIKLTEMLNNSIIINQSDDLSQVSILSTVKVLNKTSKKEMLFTIVPENETDVKSGKISSGSPIGSGLLEKKIGEIAKIKTPGGILELEIIEITK